MDRQEIRLPEQILLRHQRGAAGFRLFFGEILAPGNQVHADGFADPTDLAAKLAEAEKPQRFAGELDAERRLPEHTRLHAVVLVTDLARKLEHDADGKLGG